MVLSCKKSTYLNDVNNVANVRELTKEDVLKSVFPPDIELGEAFNSRTYSYINHDGGWAEATKAMTLAIEKVRALGGKVLEAKGVESLVKTSGVTSGVKCIDGSVLEAELVILATGAWTASTFPDLRLEERCRATGCEFLLHFILLI